MNNILGGNFGARINMNLREDKHWSYGAQSFILDARGPAAVHRVRAGADRQDQGIAGGDRQGSARNSGRQAAHRRRIGEGAGQRDPEPAGFARDHQRGGQLDRDELVEFGLPDDYYDKYAGPRARA